jgi:hypothetical protein
MSVHSEIAFLGLCVPGQQTCLLSASLISSQKYLSIAFAPSRDALCCALAAAFFPVAHHISRRAAPSSRAAPPPSPHRAPSPAVPSPAHCASRPLCCAPCPVCRTRRGATRVLLSSYSRHRSPPEGLGRCRRHGRHDTRP